MRFFTNLERPCKNGRSDSTPRILTLGQDICNAFILKRHKATAHGTRPTNIHQCDLCPLFYNLKSSLEKHIAKHHPNG